QVDHLPGYTSLCFAWSLAIIRLAIIVNKSAVQISASSRYCWPVARQLSYSKDRFMGHLRPVACPIKRMDVLKGYFLGEPSPTHPGKPVTVSTIYTHHFFTH